jgi:hypothetical protein
MVGGNLFGIEGGILFEAGGGKVLEIFKSKPSAKFDVEKYAAAMARAKWGDDFTGKVPDMIDLLSERMGLGRDIQTLRELYPDRFPGDIDAARALLGHYLAGKSTGELIMLGSGILEGDGERKRFSDLLVAGRLEALSDAVKANDPFKARNFDLFDYLSALAYGKTGVPVKENILAVMNILKKTYGAQTGEELGSILAGKPSGDLMAIVTGIIGEDKNAIERFGRYYISTMGGGGGFIEEHPAIKNIAKENGEERQIINLTKESEEERRQGVKEYQDNVIESGKNDMTYVSKRNITNGKKVINKNTHITNKNYYKKEYTIEVVEQTPAGKNEMNIFDRSGAPGA